MFDPDSDEIKSPAGFGSKPRATDPESRMPRDEGQGPIAGTKRGSELKKAAMNLDSPEAVQQHRRLISHYQDEIEKQGENRAETELDYEFYDGHQWDAEEAQILLDRGQKPIAYNIICSMVDWVTGSEKRARSDFKVLARQKEGAQQAEAKTDLLKYVNDTSRAGYHESRAFEDSVKGGLGWLEEACQDETDGEPVYIRRETWRNMLHDSMAIEDDLSDARYIFRTKWVDLDIAEAWFPDRAGFLKAAAQNQNQWGIFSNEFGDEAMDALEQAAQWVGGIDRSGEFRYERLRVRLIEAWFRKPVMVKKMRGGQFAGEIYDPNSRGHTTDIIMGKALAVDKTDMRMHCAVMTTNGLLWIGESPYRHNRFPFTPVWAFRRDKTNLPYGLIRRVRDMQEDVNRRASKALHILNTNKTLAEKGAVDDIDAWQEEASRADAFLEYNPNKKIELNVDRNLVAGHIEIMQMGMKMIQSTSGVTDENMGRETNARSGRAITARQDQGALTTAGLFDMLHLAKQISGEKRLSLIEQFFSKPKQFRITNQRGTPQYKVANSGLPQDDITATKADFVIGEAEWRATVRQAQADELIDLVKELAPVAPQIALVMLDLVVESMDVTNREEIVNRIRQQTGMSDPDATEPTPEELQKAALQQRQMEQEDRLREATIAEKEASAQQKSGAAGQAGANVAKIKADMALQNVQVQLQALQTAIAALTTPAAVPVADAISRDAGYVGRGEVEENAAVEDKATALQQLAAEGAAAQQQGAVPPGAPPPDAGGEMPPVDPTQQPVPVGA